MLLKRGAVEVTPLQADAAVRDSKNPDGGALFLRGAAWDRLRATTNGTTTTRCRHRRRPRRPMSRPVSCAVLVGFGAVADGVEDGAGECLVFGVEGEVVVQDLLGVGG
ncbi:MAG: DUF397 domain-containing protein [Actinophytocola sp.]|nr:DUF397 domain-containing protein [Actinophytocola sp.]